LYQSTQRRVAISTAEALGQAPGIVHGKVLNAPVAVVDQAIFRPRPAGVDRLFQGIQDEAGGGGGLTFQPTIRRA
jgi:hypothetical protein